jgi:signal transduction histidine kinase/ActR/RegA family two-component response regulator
MAQGTNGILPELDATNRLLRISSLFLREGNVDSVLGEIVEAAIALSNADFGSLQLFDQEASELRIVASRGLPAWWLDYWNSVPKGRGACGTALETRRRVVVEDVERSPIFVGKPDLEIQRRACIRAVQSTPIMSRSGEPIGMVSTHYRNRTRLDARTSGLLDLVAREAAEILESARVEGALRDSESRFRALADVSSEVLYRMGPDWTEMRELRSQGFLVSTPTTTTMWLDRYILPEDQAEVKAAFESAIKTRSTFALEHRVIRADGTPGWTWSRAVPVKDGDGNIVEWFGAASDVTARKQAELEREEANARLRDTDRRKTEFLALLSHELRNPLAPIRMNLDLIERVGLGSEQAIRALAVIRRQTDHLSRLVDDLLDVTRIASGKVALKRESLDLTDVLLRTVDDYRDAVTTAGLALELHVPSSPLWVNGDRTRLAQIIGNLLHNATKFTPRGGTVSVSIGEAPETGQAVLRVHDTGRGIPNEIMPRVFEPFVQADTTLDRAKGGLGLGLPVAKGLVELHGGSIAAASGPDEHGTTLTVTLPLEMRTPLQVRPKASGEPATPHTRVLVIEDNVDTADALRAVLEIDGFDTDVAYDGASGLEHARAFAPDVVVCDLGLPEIDGYQVATAMRADPQLRHTALVAVTGYGLASDVEKTKQAGFDDHLVKPVGADELARVLAKVTHAPH